MVIGDWEQTRGYNLKVGDVLTLDYFIDGYNDMVVCTVDEVDDFNVYVQYIHPWIKEVMFHSLRREGFVYWRLKV